MKVSSSTPYDTIATVYDELFVRPRDLAENVVVARHLRGLKGIDGRVLDVGCGTGFLINAANIDHDRYVGIDVSDGMLEVAQGKFPAHMFVKQDMCEMAFESGVFDCCVALWSFSYSPFPKKAAAEMLRVTKKGGGIFVIAYTQWGKNDSPLPYENWQQYRNTPRHLFRVQDLRDLFGQRADIKFSGLSARCVPDWLGTKIARLECAVLGRLFPEKCRYIMLTGVKCA